MKKLSLLPVFFMLVCSYSCIKLEHEMSIKPVYVTVEIRVKIDKELDDFFGDIDAKTIKK